MECIQFVFVFIVFSISTKVHAKTKVHLLTPEEGCGYTNVTNNKIVGGGPAKLGAWPWMARVAFKVNVNGTIRPDFKCGGTLITSRHVLTAAHCIQENLSFVRLGEYDTSTVKDGPNEDVDVVHVAKHPKYNLPFATHDIAILTLKHDVNFSDRIRPICLPIKESLRNRTFAGSNPFVIGWGRLAEYGNTATILQQLQVPVHKNVICRNIFDSRGNLICEEQFGDAIICAGNLAGGQDSCRGDSGGPLMIPINENQKFPFYQIGIVSWGIGCAKPNSPGIYARVANYIDWIKMQID